MAKGIVYALINDAMPGFVKIGKTEQSLENRMRALDSTGVPLPFVCYHAVTVPDVDFAEKALHAIFADRRVREKREFFRIDPERVKAALDLAAFAGGVAGGVDVTPKEDVIETADDQKALDQARTRRSSLRFSEIGVPVGAVLTSTFDEKATCQVIADGRVLFRERETSLSDAALIIAHENGYRWKSIGGPTYWLYDGRTLTDLRVSGEEQG